MTSQMDPLSGLSSMAIWQLLPPCDLGKCEMFQGRLDLDVLNICLKALHQSRKGSESTNTQHACIYATGDSNKQ